MKLLKFHATWCVPCKTVSKLLDEYLPRDLDLIEFDIDEHVDTAKAYGIRSIPTLILMDDKGNEVERLTGVPGVSTIRTFLKQAPKD